MAEEVLIVLIAMGFASVTGLGFGIMRMINLHLDRKAKAAGATDDSQLRADLEDLGSRLELTEDLRTRVLELEERVDFTERMLIEERERKQLPADS